jgi:hypothetical protein
MFIPHRARNILAHSHTFSLTHTTHPRTHTHTPEYSLPRSHARTQPSPPPLPPTESIAEEWNAAFADTNKRTRDDVFKTGRGYTSSGAYTRPLFSST